MNFYKHYLGDYARKTAHLSLSEHGAYRRLLDHYYATSKPLPADLDALCRICGGISTAEQKAIKKVADEFFPVNGDGSRHNKRADQELNGYTAQADTNRRIAAEREAKRKRNEPSNDPLNDQSTNDQPKPEVRSQKLEVKKPEAVNQKPERSKALARATRLPKDWTLPTVWAEWTEETLGWPHKRVYEVAEIFKDYWIAAPGTKGTKLDWQATWRNWCRNQRASGKSSDGNAAAFEEAEREIFGAKEKDITDESKRI